MNVSFSREFRAFSSDPIEWAINIPERWAELSEHRSKSRGPHFMPWPPCPYAIDDEWEEKLHKAVDAPWPCPAHNRFETMWWELIDSLKAQVGNVGRGAFGQERWGDTDTAMARIVYCMTSHLRPERLLETGVARGITTRFILEALAENGHGHLWSIDLPPPGEPEIHGQIGMAVPDRLRPWWTYVPGSSRRKLRPLLTEIKPIDLFVHDSRHTQRNLMFELQHAWSALTRGGVAIVDDVDLNCGFHEFRRTYPEALTFVGRAEPLEPDLGRQDDTGVVAIALRPY